MTLRVTILGKTNEINNKYKEKIKMKTLTLLIVSLFALFTGCVFTGCVTVMPSLFQDDYFVPANERGTDIYVQIVNARPHVLHDVIVNSKSLKDFYRGTWANVQIGWALVRESAYYYRGRTSKGYPKLIVPLQIIGYFETDNGIKMYLPRGVGPGKPIIAEEEHPLLIVFDDKSQELGPAPLSPQSGPTHHGPRQGQKK